MDKLKQAPRPTWLPEPLPVLAPRALDMAGSFLLAWNPGAAAPSPFAAGYVCALPRDQSVYAAFGAFLGYLLTGSRLGAAFGCALALCMVVQLLTGWEKQMPALGAAACLVCGLIPGETALWRLVLTCALSGLLGQFLRISRTGSHGHARYSLTGKLCLLCLVLVVLRPLSVVGGLMTLGFGVWLFGERRLSHPGAAKVPPPPPAPQSPREPALRRAEEAIGKLREAFAPPERQEEDRATAAFLRGAEQVCGSCEKRQECWGTEYRATRAAVAELTPVLRRSHRIEPSDLPHSFLLRCCRPERFCDAVGQHYAAALRRGAALQQQDRQHRLVQDQLEGMQRLVRRAAGEPELPRYLPHLERRIRAVTAAYCPGSSLRVLRHQRRLLIELGLPHQGELPDLSALERSLELALACRFHPPRVLEGEGGRLLRLTQRESLAVSVSTGQKPRAGEQTCGDSLLQLQTGDGRALVLLSDGMGSGEAARELSRTALELIAAFLRAGCSLEESCAAVLPVLAARGEQTGFVTLDLLELDLYSGEGLLLKCGAAKSWLLRGGRMEGFSGTALPAGLDPEEPPDRKTLRLRPGDRLLMLSDGVCGPEGQEPEGLLAGVLQQPPDDLIGALLAAAPDRDDRTALLLTVSQAP